MSGEILITVNSPGEVATWLTPVVRALREIDAQARVRVFVMPCTYASGTEAAVVARIPGVDQVIPPRESLNFALFGRAPAGFKPPGVGVLLFLGGEFYLAARLAQRLSLPAAAYTEGYINSASAFERVFVPRESAKARIAGRRVLPERIAVVGDLMVDAARMRLDQAGGEALPGTDGSFEPGDPGESGALIALLPGSRPHEVRHGLPLFFRAGAELARRWPGVRFTVPISPFATAESFRLGLDALGVKEGQEGIEALFLPGGAGSLELRLPVEGSVIDVVFERARAALAMARADLALTIPGSNTAELAVYGVPMIVCLPLDRPEEIPLDGIAGLLDKVPLLGRRLKAAAVLKTAGRTKFTALPNRVAQEYVVPELKSASLDAARIAEAASALLADPQRLERMGARLKSLMGPAGAARSIAGWLLDRLGREGSSSSSRP